MIKISNLPEKYAAAPLHPALQFLIFIVIFVGVLLIGTALGLGLVVVIYGLKMFTAISQLAVTTPHFVPAMWIVQLFGTTLPILAAPLIFSRVVVKNIANYIKPGINFSWILMVLVFVIMFMSSPVIELLTNINQKMVLPHFLQWMRDSEDSAEKLTAILLQMKTAWQMLFNLIFIGLLTAVVEEFMFRGVMQTIFEKWTKNTHAAIWITAILFSAFHMEFFGFLPRLLLGAMFGYFVAWSGSIWPAVFAHFLNNGTAVVVTYLYQNKLIKLNPDDQHVFTWAGYTVSITIILFLFYVYHYTATKKPVQA
jgi:membrane protease YdiL (CAAX protease family)